MEFYNTKNIKKTRKIHRCVSCHLDIPKSSACFYQCGKYDGDFFSDYSHNECAEEATELNKYNQECGEEWIPLEMMAEYYSHNSFRDWQTQIGEKYGVQTPD